MADKYLPDEYKNIARIRQLKSGQIENPNEVIPIKTAGDLTAEAPPEIQKTISKEDLQQKIADFRAARAARKATNTPVESTSTPESGTPINASEAVKSNVPTQKFGLSSIAKGTLKSAPFLNIAHLPFAAKEAQEQRPNDVMGQAGIMAGVPAELLPAQPVSEQEAYQELKKRLGADNPA